MCAAPRLGDKVDRLSRSTYENDLIRTGGVNQPSNLGTCLFISGSRLLADFVDSTVNVCVVLVVKTGQFIDYLSRLLAGSRTVKICKRFSIDQAVENWKIMPDPVDIVRVLAVNICCRLFLRSVSLTVLWASCPGKVRG